jgi:hypothetical protein
MSQGMKYLKEENMGEITASYAFHTTMNILSDSKYKKKMMKFTKTHKAGMEAVRSWIKWTYNIILTEEFSGALIKLEDAMREEHLIGTKIYKVFEAIMLVQELSEDPVAQIQRMSQKIEEINEIESSSPEEEAWKIQISSLMNN